ncbi:MAG: hypothetical protein J0L99_18710 [Chitinophagales bacterium]|nr:hypothetical protein [Chitinophagales bacterium]
MKYVFCFLLGITCLSSLFAQKQATRKNYLYYDFAHWSKKGYSVFNLGYEIKLRKNIALHLQGGAYHFKKATVDSYSNTTVDTCEIINHFFWGPIPNCKSYEHLRKAEYGFHQRGIWLGIGPKFFTTIKKSPIQFYFNPEFQIYLYRYDKVIHKRVDVDSRDDYQAIVHSQILQKDAMRTLFIFNCNFGLDYNITNRIRFSVGTAWNHWDSETAQQAAKKSRGLPEAIVNTPDRPLRYIDRPNLQLKLGIGL